MAKETFTAFYIKDRAKPIREQTPKIAATLRANGRTPWSMEVTDNHIIMKGTIDGEDDSNPNS